MYHVFTVSIARAGDLASLGVTISAMGQSQPLTCPSIVIPKSTVG